METKIQISDVAVEVLSATAQSYGYGQNLVKVNVGFNSRMKYHSETFIVKLDASEVEAIESEGDERMMELYSAANYNDYLENEIYAWVTKIKGDEESVSLVEELKDFSFKATAAEMEKKSLETQSASLDFTTLVEQGDLDSMDEVLEASYCTETAVFRIKHTQGGDLVFFEVSDATFENDLELVHFFAEWAKKD
jgi:hypothetical protein